MFTVANGSGVPVVGKEPAPKLPMPRGLVSAGNDTPKLVAPNEFGTVAAVLTSILLKKKS